MHDCDRRLMKIMRDYDDYESFSKGTMNDYD